MPIKNGFDKVDFTINISSAFIFHKSTLYKLYDAALQNTAGRGTARQDTAPYLFGRMAARVRSRQKRLIPSRMCDTSSSRSFSSLVND